MADSNNVVPLHGNEHRISLPLECPGVGRDKDCANALQFYFSRPIADDEMRFLHDVMRRAVSCMPKDTQR